MILKIVTIVCPQLYYPTKVHSLGGYPFFYQLLGTPEPNALPYESVQTVRKLVGSYCGF